MKEFALTLSHILSALLGIIIISRVILVKNFQDSGSLAIGIFIILSLIWFKDFRATYILLFGWLESKPGILNNQNFPKQPLLL